ncbi:hypothetical protein NVP1193O_162 [Vibrio phage 1.193.O._10N.286.52.C6]|nr:hypothetical protein NVP1193O_162 [Vibrio phage 1.193.O._10N.286.52.C6]
MNKLKLTLLTLLVSGNSYAIDYDKKLHLGVSTAIGAFTQYQLMIGKLVWQCAQA